jgi:transposase
MDMSNAFRDAVRMVLPEAAIVADTFLVIAHVNDVLWELCQQPPRTRNEVVPSGTG